MVLPTLPKSYLGKNGIYLFLDKALRYASYSSKILKSARPIFCYSKFLILPNLKTELGNIDFKVNSA